MITVEEPPASQDFEKWHLSLYDWIPFFEVLVSRVGDLHLGASGGPGFRKWAPLHICLMTFLDFDLPKQGDYHSGASGGSGF